MYICIYVYIIHHFIHMYPPAGAASLVGRDSSATPETLSETSDAPTAHYEVLRVLCIYHSQAQNRVIRKSMSLKYESFSGSRPSLRRLTFPPRTTRCFLFREGEKISWTCDVGP